MIYSPDIRTKINRTNASFKFFKRLGDSMLAFYVKVDKVPFEQGLNRIYKK